MRHWILVSAALIIALGFVLVYFGFLPSGDFPAPAPERWQAVFLSNGQVYFGRLENYDRGYARLTSVYYLRAADALQQGGGEANQSINLVKLGGELHGPEDEMFIPKDKIQFWENLKASSQVVRAIEGAGGAGSK